MPAMTAQDVSLQWLTSRPREARAAVAVEGLWSSDFLSAMFRRSRGRARGRPKHPHAAGRRTCGFAP